MGRTPWDRKDDGYECEEGRRKILQHGRKSEAHGEPDQIWNDQHDNSAGDFGKRNRARMGLPRVP